MTDEKMTIALRRAIVSMSDTSSAEGIKTALGLDETDLNDLALHTCKYCGALTLMPERDILCSDCKIDFGHSLYSEL